MNTTLNSFTTFLNYKIQTIAKSIVSSIHFSLAVVAFANFSYIFLFSVLFTKDYVSVAQFVADTSSINKLYLPFFVITSLITLVFSIFVSRIIYKKSSNLRQFWYYSIEFLIAYLLLDCFVLATMMKQPVDWLITLLILADRYILLISIAIYVSQIYTNKLKIKNSLFSNHDFFKYKGLLRRKLFQIISKNILENKIYRLLGSGILFINAIVITEIKDAHSVFILSMAYILISFIFILLILPQIKILFEEKKNKYRKEIQ